MNGGHHGAIQSAIQFAPLARGYGGASCQAHGLEHATNDDRIGGEHFTQQGDGWFVRAPAPRRLHRPGHGFGAGVFQHGACQHVFGLGMGGDAKAWHVDADDANAVDLFGQYLQRHTAGGGHAQVDDHDGVVQGRVGLLVHGFTDVFKQFAGDQGL